MKDATMAVAVVASFANTVFKENKMGQKKSTLISYLVQLVLAAVIVLAIHGALVPRLDVSTSAHRVYADLPAAWELRCWSDALFIPAVLWLGMGGMMWVATTDFFDIFRYAFSSLLVLFSPLKNPKDHKHFYEYKLERAEKRKGKAVPVTLLVIGVLLVAGALVTSFIHEDMVAPWYEEHAAVTAPADADVLPGIPADDIPTNDIEGGESHE